MKQYNYGITLQSLKKALRIIKNITKDNITDNNIIISSAMNSEFGTLSVGENLIIVCDLTNGNKDFYIFLVDDDLEHEDFETALSSEYFSFTNTIWNSVDGTDIVLLK